MIALHSCSTIGAEVIPSVPPAEPVNETLNPHVVCPQCAEAFQPKRRDQRYCNRQCQKAATNHNTRGSRKVADSWDEKRRHETRTGRVWGLSNALYEAPPAYRAEFMERLIAEARGNAELRRPVTARAYLRSWDRDEGTGRQPPSGLRPLLTRTLADAVRPPVTRSLRGKAGDVGHVTSLGHVHLD